MKTILELPTRLHWNYFLTLEKDLEAVSRYIEFCPANLQVFSIELARLLFAAASEVDTVAKCICDNLNPTAKANTIVEYREVIAKDEESTAGQKFLGRLLTPEERQLTSAIKIHIARYNIEITPWESWANNKSPDWWLSYNKVKHKRNQHFQEATLQNAIYALGALLIFNYKLCCLELSKQAPGGCIRGTKATQFLHPESTLLRLPDNYYYCYSQLVTMGF